MAFQSTLPVRGGTLGLTKYVDATKFQSTLPVRGGTQLSVFGKDNARFQSTLPVRGGTEADGEHQKRRGISIHPPRAGRDVVGCG